jgi:maltose alpha-D-glucosyltransferase/alpha-amylase
VDTGRLVIMSTADHDFSRLCCGPRTADQLAPALTFLLTWGSVPCIYYGDEIGMRYLPGMLNVEGSMCNPDYNRAGCRTPMQWDDNRPNAGFSTADPSSLYLPIDADAARPTVVAQERDPGSTLNFVRRLVALRRSTPALGSRTSTRVLNQGYPFVYMRGGTHLVIVNPRRDPAELHVDEMSGAASLISSGISVAGNMVTAEGFSYGVFARSA